MATWIVIGVLAAFGALCILWVLFGFLLPGQRGSVTVYLCRGGEQEEPLIRRHRWLRDLGLTHSPLIGLDAGLSEEECLRLTRKGVTICDMAELSATLEQERMKLDRT
ncbi:MAG: hypothetical protein E7466_00805 [Ruminococcaceae bacterium]|nr:hypothetical protein [Oscillospiraceae bacterium]